MGKIVDGERVRNSRLDCLIAAQSFRLQGEQCVSNLGSGYVFGICDGKKLDGRALDFVIHSLFGKCQERESDAIRSHECQPVHFIEYNFPCCNFYLRIYWGMLKQIWAERRD